MNSLNDHLEQKLSQRREENSYRQLRLRDPSKIDFFSNDYLGLAAREKIYTGENVYAGSTGSRLLGGNFQEHESFEDYLAGFHQAEAALLFNSGYAANTGIFSCLLGRGDTFIYDERVHASIRDGLRLSHATLWPFKHNDLYDLEKKLKKAKNKMIITVESVYSMDGDFAPLKEMVFLAEKYGAEIIVDEAHAVGIFGAEGEGRVVEENLQDKIKARIITFGKAIGSHGAAVLGSKTIKNYLINFSRPFIYTTALPPKAVNEIRSSYEMMKQHPEWRKQLHELISFYRGELKNKNKPDNFFTNSFSPVQTILVPGNDKVKKLSEKLFNEGFDVRPILSPTVPKGKERLRICLHAFNNRREIAGLLEATLQIA